jgi:hypothetical protein
MDIIVNLEYNRTAMVEGEHEIMLPEDLRAVFKSTSYKLSELVVNVRNGKKVDQVKVKDGILDLTPFLFGGLLEMEAALIVRGKTVKKWSVTPIILNETDKGFEVFDIITDLLNRVADLERKTKVIM